CVESGRVLVRADTGERARDQQRDMSCVERGRDAARGEDEGTDAERESDGGGPEGEPGQEPGGQLGRQDARAGGAGVDEEGWRDGPVAVFAGDEQHSGEAGEDQRDAAVAEQVELVALRG